MNRRWIISAGHGGVAFGHYFTPGKRSPGKKTATDPGIFEGEVNRIIAGKIVDSLGNAGLFLNPGPINIPLKSKVAYVNSLAAVEKVALVEIHCNAAPGGGWSDAKGFSVHHAEHASVFTENLSDAIRRSWISKVPEIPNRGIKIGNFVMCVKTKCPAVIVECGFMTNRNEADYLSVSYIQDKIAHAISTAIILFDISLTS